MSLLDECLQQGEILEHKQTGRLLRMVDDVLYSGGKNYNISTGVYIITWIVVDTGIRDAATITSSYRIHELDSNCNYGFSLHDPIIEIERVHMPTVFSFLLGALFMTCVYLMSFILIGDVICPGS